MVNNCSKIRCPFTAYTIKDCKMKEKECPFYVKEVTNGDMVEAMLMMLVKDGCARLEINQSISRHSMYIDVSDDWWNTPYVGGIKW